MSTEPLAKEGYEFMAAAFEVCNDLGSGFTEEIYQECLETELASRGIEHVAQPELVIHFKGRPIRKKLRPDLVACGEIVVELKAVKKLCVEHEAQILNYLNAARKPVGYLLNYGSHGQLEWKRFARTRNISGN